MKHVFPLRFVIVALAALLALTRADAAPAVSALQAVARNGQIFLTWREADTPAGTTFNAYVSARPIQDVTTATRIGHHIEPRSAMDWWENPAAMSKQKPADRSHGFRLEAGGAGLDPTGGLFVHTVRSGTGGQLFFAVTSTGPDGREAASVIPGANGTAQGVAAVPGRVQPIWQGKGAMPPAGAGAGMPLSLSLHGKSGVIAESEYLAFGDASLGWREGLPFKFSVRIQNNEVVIRPTDRVWINRDHTEASDGGTPAIWTFWYGYNSAIYDRALMPTGTPTNYTERRLLWILDWVQHHYQTDRNRWYCSGSSMGGCGTISFGLRHPELFAACHAHVPIVSYTYDAEAARSSARRLEPAVGPGRIAADQLTDEGVPLLARMNGTAFVARTNADLPFLFLVNGRQDGSIPWANNPPFYRAIDAGRHGYAAYWDDGRHDTAGKDAPEDVKGWMKAMRRFRLNESFPAFSATTTDRNPGTGDPADGDRVGWMNRGMDWGELEDTAGRYALTLRADFPGIVFPVRTTVTLRRVQQFKPRPGEPVNVALSRGPARNVTVDADGRITLPDVVIPDREGVRLILSRR